MKPLPRTVRVALLTLLTSVGACARVDLYPVTRGTSAGNGAGDSVASAGGGGNGGEGGDAGRPISCPDPGIDPGDSNQTVLVGGSTRSYVLHVPALYNATKPAPLVVDFHGIGGTGKSERSTSPYPPALDAEGVIMAFPDGLKGPAGTAWNVGPCCVADVDDVAFARALVSQVRSLACIETKRVYAVGVLTGGGMANYVACRAGDVFAAVAPAAFDLLAENADDCLPPRPVTVISFRGTADSRVPYDGGPSSLVAGMPLTFLGAQSSYEKWAAINGCVGAASAPDGNGCSAFSGCAGGAEVILCTRQAGGDEPGKPSISWPVLARHTL
ncbi:MAG: PHB depolymerase family esterase [Polyangiaceae bacterium]